MSVMVKSRRGELINVARCLPDTEQLKSLGNGVRVIYAGLQDATPIPVRSSSLAADAAKVLGLNPRDSSLGGKVGQCPL